MAGDAGGMVNPFNGEGIAYAMESGEILARNDVLDARPELEDSSLRRSAADRELEQHALPDLGERLLGGPPVRGADEQPARSTPS